MKKINIAIIGHGFVGKAVEYGFTPRGVTCNKQHSKKFIVDPKDGIDIDELPFKELDLTFVCVPTPMGWDHSIDSSIVDSVMAKLVKEKASGLIVLKSTVTPDVVDRIHKIVGEKFVYNPEFLTERKANQDFVNPIMHVFGGEYSSCLALSAFYEHYSTCKPCKEHYVTPVEASFIKYGINSFLATKVAWMNQYRELVLDNGGNWASVISAMRYDNRIGSSHTHVPGHDGRLGFGGACFTKDCAAIHSMSDNLNGDDLTILGEAISYNNIVRSQYEDLDDREKEQNVTYN